MRQCDVKQIFRWRSSSSCRSRGPSLTIVTVSLLYSSVCLCMACPGIYVGALHDPVQQTALDRCLTKQSSQARPYIRDS
ncbi:hypothetical protein IE81DRAFT_210940 [Ceraceosorus guamensis]|uniref:Uncharacterized protein n=1 Tax=Ceraceosorus guamensis TaxID=1522189 RepID=A0A316W5P4_9BASI|nr:hypothetical protein IE81DRAFT_210940 [Ceraceosorus guamensis]PWN45280.1 hypothetical protein IE81DRAFT_210940 [Ceraceosorus guamensis]